MAARPPLPPQYLPMPPPQQPFPGMPPPWPPPGYAAAPLPAAKGRPTLEFVVVVVVAAVAIVAVAVPAILYAVGNSSAPPVFVSPTAVLQGSGSWASNGTTSTYTFTISTVAPSGAIIDPSQLQYIVANSADTPLYSGAAGQHTSSGGFDVNVDYQDPLNAGAVSPGDRIRIQVSPVASNPLVGGSIQVNFNGSSLATGHM